MAMPSCPRSAAGIILRHGVPKQGASAPPAAPVPAPSSVQPAPTVPNGLKQSKSLAAPEQARSSVAAPDQAPKSAQPAPAVQKPAVPPVPTVAKPAAKKRPQDAGARLASPEPAPKFAQPELPVPKHVATAHLAAPMPALSSAQLAAMATVMPPPTSREDILQNMLVQMRQLQLPESAIGMILQQRHMSLDTPIAVDRETQAFHLEHCMCLMFVCVSFPELNP